MPTSLRKLRLLGHDPVDNGDGSAECGLYIQTGGVQQVGIGRRIKAAMGVGAVPRVPFLYLVIERVAINHLAAEFERFLADREDDGR